MVEQRFSGMYDKISGDNTDIKYIAESANFKGGTFYKHSNGLLGNRFKMPNVSYTHPFKLISCLLMLRD